MTPIIIFTTNLDRALPFVNRMMHDPWQYRKRYTNPYQDPAPTWVQMVLFWVSLGAVVGYIGYKVVRHWL